MSEPTFEEDYDTELVGGPADGKRLSLAGSVLIPGPLGKVQVLRLVLFEEEITTASDVEIARRIVQEAHLYEIVPNPASDGAVWLGNYKGIEEIGG